MGYLEKWRKEIEDSRIKKEKESKENIIAIYLLGVFMFGFGAFITILTTIKLLIFSDFFSFFGLIGGCAIFLMGLSLMSFAIAGKNSIIRKFPER